MKNYYLFILLAMFLTGCGAGSNSPRISDETIIPNTEAPAICSISEGINWPALLSEDIDNLCSKLSDYRLFSDATDPRSGANIGGVRYELNSQLFTDYARKYRYLYIPNEETAEYSKNEVFDFPVGTVLAKVFSLPEDTGNTEESIIEVRLMIHRPSGWVGLPYVWDDNVKDGFLDLDGESIEFSLAHKGKEYSDYYSVPSYGSCRTCHQFNGSMSLIGLKARNLNKSIEFEGESINQLQLWGQQGLLSGLPTSVVDIDYAPDWQDASKKLEERAKSYLDINCAHCHREEGAASLSGLKLEFGRKSVDYNHGVCNSAHGWRGGGFDIWPGDSENSSIPLRMTLSAAPDRMPPLGRSIVDVEAVELIKQWIDSMPYQECAEAND